MKRTLVDGNDELAMAIGRSAKVIVDHPVSRIQKYFDDDPDLREQALEMLDPDAGIYFPDEDDPDQEDSVQ